MQVSQTLTVRLVVQELTGLPGKSVARAPVDFSASAVALDSFVQRSAYCTGAGPGGTNVIKYFWMHPDQAAAFDAATQAALCDHFTVTLI